MILPRAAATGVLLLRTATGALPAGVTAGVLPPAASVGASPFATTFAASPLAVAVGDCPETSVAHSKKQNSVEKMILMEKDTTVLFSGAWALGLNFVMRQNLLAGHRQEPRKARADQLVPHPRDSPARTLFCFIQAGTKRRAFRGFGCLRALLEVEPSNALAGDSPR